MRAVRFGLAIMAVALLYSSVMRGRISAIQATCSAIGQPTAAQAMGRTPGMAHGGQQESPFFGWALLQNVLWSRYLPAAPLFSGGWRWLSVSSCYLRESGMFAAGLAAMWHWAVVLLRYGGIGAGSSLDPVLDVALGLGVVGGAAGCCLVASLGACWIAWLGLWLSWLAVLGGMCSAERVSGFALQGSVALVAMGLPVAMGTLPFSDRMQGFCEHCAASNWFYFS